MGRHLYYFSLDTNNTAEAKAKRESYRHELEKQIEQAKIRRQEEEKREKDLNDHPLGSTYAQPKQYSHPKFQSASLITLGLGKLRLLSRQTDLNNAGPFVFFKGPKSSSFEEQFDETGRDTQPVRSRSQPVC